MEAIPLPQFVAGLGDLEHLAGNETAARRQYALIGAIQKLLRANGVRTDLETALFDVDHARRLPKALSLAKAARRERPSIDGDDVLAWALARNGHCTAALHYSKRSLRLGTRDASEVLPSRHGGTVSRPRGGRKNVVPPGSVGQPAFLPSLGARRQAGTRHEAPRAPLWSHSPRSLSQ